METHEHKFPQDHKIIDLVKNEYFVQWILTPNKESTHYWVEWINLHPERKKDVELARQLIQSAQYEQQYQMPEDDYRMVLQNVVEHSQNAKNTEFKKNRKSSWRFLSIAASILFLIVLGALMIDLVPDEKEVVVATNKTNTIIKKALKGQRLKIVLPDGSKVVLNAESQLSYDLPFRNTRNVRLEGEAFFDVVRDIDHTFTVFTNKVTTTVLGTSFNVRAYANEDESSIAVVSGKVAVADEFGNEALLNKDSQGVFAAEQRQLLIQAFDKDEIVGWKDGIMIFTNTPLTEVISRLERIYGVQFDIENRKVLEGKYTGRYDNASLRNVLDGVSYAVGFNYQMEGNDVKITDE